MKIAVVGSRDYINSDYIYSVLDSHILKEDKIISGGARGVDSIAIKYAKDRGLDWEEYPADWKTYGKSAGYIRNAKIAKICDVLIAFHKNNSRGTANVIKLAKEEKKEVYTYFV